MRKEDAVCASFLHAIGQAASVCHVETHIVGFMCYELTGIIYQNRYQDIIRLIEKKLICYEKRLLRLKIN